MLLVDPKPLFKKLTKNCHEAMTGAFNAATNSRHYEITVEHVLLTLLDDADSDIAFIVSHYDLNASQIRGTLQRALEEFRTGNSGRATFSPLVLEWIQDAWTTSSVDFEFAKIRSGTLFLRLVQSPNKYSSSNIGMLLEGIPKEDMKKNLPTILSGSKEGAEAAAGGGLGGGGKAAGGAPGARGGETALSKYCIDYTGRARAGEIDPIFGREREIRQIIDILARRRKNNPIIVGDSGVGKTALVEGLALLIVNNEVPPLLQGVEIFGLDLGLLQAGASVSGEFENRMKGVISEIKGSAKPIILFIDEAHTIIGAGGKQGGGDAANLLKPALARGELRTIAATTWKEYKKYFEKDAALERRFQPVKVDEPDVAVATTMLRGLREKFEDSHKVIVRDDAVTAAVRLSARYISGRQLPDKAVDLLDTCCARVKVALQQKPAQVEDLEVIIKNVERELAALERDKLNGVRVDEEHIGELKVKLEKTKVELEGVAAAFTRETDASKKVHELRKKMEELQGEARDEARKEVLAALDELDKMQGETPLIRPDVDEASVATVVSAWTGIPVGKMVQDDVRALLEMEDRLRKRIKGQDHAIHTIAKELRAARAGLKPQSTPMGVFILVGPSGVGKTETALSLADMLYGGERMMVTINMSEFQEKHTVSRLIGSPPGYVGFGEGGMLTEAVRQRPYTVVLLDECEKADPDVMNLFYQVFDKGMLSDGEGRLVDFKNTVVIMTSNLATDKITNLSVSHREDNDGKDPEIAEILEAIKPTVSGHFKPALLARMTMVPYLPISQSALGQITRLKLDQLLSRLKSNQRIDATYSDSLVELIAQRCTEVDTGARNIDHILRASLLPMLSNAILEKMVEGNPPKKLFIDLDAEKNFTAHFS